jgi:hypothetical protein
MPRKPVPCPRCGVKRNVGGNAPPDRVCWDCHIKGEGRPSPKQPGKGKAYAWRSQHQSESLADRERRYPKSSWWAEAPREQWGAVVEKQREDRFQAGGCGVSATQKGLSE